MFGGAAFCGSLLAAALLAFLLAQPGVQRWHDERYGVLNVSDSDSDSGSQASPSPAAASIPAAPPLPPPLQRFYQASDVDHALIAAKMIGKAYQSAEYESALRHLLRWEWLSDPQAVYNVLQHSYMIPPDVRFEMMLRGLLEKEETQYRLAAAVGVQFTNRAFFERAPKAERRFREILLHYAREDREDDFLSARSFLAVKDLLHHPRDTRFVLTLVAALNWRNCLTWLVRNVATEEQPLTSARLRSMLTEAIEQEKNGQVSSQAEAYPSTVPWTDAWSKRLKAVDVNGVIDRIGVALDDHAAKVAAKQHSVLSNYQEVDVPSYAPLQMGQTNEGGAMKRTHQPQPASSAPPSSRSAPPTLQPDTIIETDTTEVTGTGT